MIYKDRNGKPYVDHEPICKIWNAQDRACTCTVRFPFPKPAGKWEGWLTATPQQQAEMVANYKRVIEVEIITNFMHWNGYRGP